MKEQVIALPKVPSSQTLGVADVAQKGRLIFTLLVPNSDRIPKYLLRQERLFFRQESA